MFTRDAEDYWIEYAQREVFAQTGDRVSVRQKAKQLRKWGRSTIVDTSLTTLCNFGASQANEVYVSDNLITHISSDDNGDNQNIYYEGHTVDGSGNFTFVTDTVTNLTGNTKIALPTPVARISRAQNTDTTVYDGNIYFYEDTAISGGIPTDQTKIHLVIHPEQQRSFKSASTISQFDYYFITEVTCSVARKVAADIDVYLEIREKGGIFQQIVPLSISTDGNPTVTVYPKPYIIVPKNADIRMRAAALAGSAIEVTGKFNGVLAVII